MCEFFSVTSDGLGNIKYFNWEQRQQISRGKLDYSADSHTSINDYYGFKGAKEDSRNKYEFNPLTGIFVVDAINSINDSKIVEEKVRALDFKAIVEPLIIKPIINPFKVDTNDLVITQEHINLLKQWASVNDSVWESVRVSVWDSVRDSVWDSVRDSVWDSVRDSVWDSVRDSVWESVRESVRDSVRAYTSSFFTLETWKGIEHEPFTNPFQSCINLWEMGIVPSFDGSTWRLYCGLDARVVYEISKENLQKWI